MAEMKVSAGARVLTDRARPGGRKAPPGGEGEPPERRRSTWQRRAACRKSPTALFFPVGRSEQTRAEEGPAKVICSACPVRARCLAFALEREEPFGVWGGLNPEERQALAEARQQAGAG